MNFCNKILDFVTCVATTARPQRDYFEKKSHHHHKAIAHVAMALSTVNSYVVQCQCSSLFIVNPNPDRKRYNTSMITMNTKNKYR